MNEKTYVIQDLMSNKGEVQEARIVGPSGESGGSVTPASVLAAIQSMSTYQKTAVREALNAASADDPIPEALKIAMLDIADNVVYNDTDNAPALIAALDAALYPIDHITANYTQSGTIYDTDSLDSLKADLVVTAIYADGTEDTVAPADYALSGTLTEGTSTITVTYKGKTATFDVDVTHSAVLISLTESDLARKRGLDNNAPNYYTSAAGRISYSPFDLLIPGGKTYKFTATAVDAATGQMGIRFFNQAVLDSVAASQNYSTSDEIDSTWQSLTFTYALPAQINGSDTKGFRIAFRDSAHNTLIPDDFAITSLIVEEVTS